MPPAGIRADELSAILLAPTGRDAQLMWQMLEGQGVRASAVESMESLIEAAGREYRAGLLVIAAEALQSRKADKLNRYLSEEPVWSDLPVLVLGRTQVSDGARGALMQRRSSQLLYRPLKPAVFSSAVSAALEIRSRQYQVRALLANAHELNEELREQARQLQQLSFQLSTVEERERRRMAVYVHDKLQQTLAGAKFHVDLAERRLSDQAKTHASLNVIRDLVMEAIEGTRTLSQELSPVALRRHGLVSGLKWLARHLEKMQGLQVNLDSDLTREPEEPSVVTFLFRAAQELLLNVSKHAATDRAELILRNEGDEIIFEVKDRGSGFDVADWKRGDSDGGFGLFSLTERAKLLGGSVAIDALPGEGTRVTLSVPDPGSATPPAPTSPSSSVTGASVAPREGSGPVKVLLVDDHTVLRAGLRLVLADHPDIEILGEFGDGKEAVEAADALRPDLIFMDVSMPAMDGLEATRIIKERHPEIRIIALSMFDDASTREKMLSAGAEEYLVKADPSEELLAAVFSPPGV